MSRSHPWKTRPAGRHLLGNVDDDNVGYGDLTPQTTSGQAVAIVVMLVGIGFVAVVTGAIAQRFAIDKKAIEASEADTLHAEAITHAKLDDLARRMETMEQALLHLAEVRPSPSRADGV